MPEYLITALLGVVSAPAPAPPISLTQGLVVYGPLGLWVIWFIIRDINDRKDRKADRDDQERRHKENLDAQRKVEQALRTNTNSQMVTCAALKHLDVALGDVVTQVNAMNKDENPDRR
jgi:hypothetical protein